MKTLSAFDLSNIIKNIILEYIYPKKENFIKKGKPNSSWGRGDFQKAGQIGLKINSPTDKDGNNIDDGYIYRNIPGVKYPLERTEQSFRGTYDKDDPIAQEIVKRILFGSEKITERCLFFNGVVRMVCDGEVNNKKDYKMLSDICIYLSENPTLLSNDKPFDSKDWENGFSNFYKRSFEDLKDKFGEKAKQYCENKRNFVENDLITSNGYYVYPCYNFATANYVRSFMKQGMCYTGTDNFFHEHMGDSGVLFLFIKKDKPQVYDNNNRVYMGSGNLSLNEFGIAIGVDVEKKPYIESITDGTNMSLYNSQYKDSKTSQYFSENDIKELSKILGTLNGEEIFNYCLRSTKERQNSKYDPIFKSGTYDHYEKLLNSKYKYNSTKINGVTVFYDGEKFICLDKEQEIVIIISIAPTKEGFKKGFVTINGNEVVNAKEEPTLIEISKFIGDILGKKWIGFKDNKKNPRTCKYHNNFVQQGDQTTQHKIALEESLKPWNVSDSKKTNIITESQLRNIIKETILEYLRK